MILLCCKCHEYELRSFVKSNVLHENLISAQQNNLIEAQVFISVKQRDEYMQALEKASVNGDITAFAKFLGELVE